MAETVPNNRIETLANPFRPGNGVRPPYLAGRDRVLDAFEDWLIEQPPLHARSYLRRHRKVTKVTRSVLFEPGPRRAATEA